MKRHIGIAIIVATWSVGGCGGGYAADPPANVTVVAKDSRLVVTWDMAPGVEYWVYKAAGDGVTPTNCSSMPSCSTTLAAVSPTTISGLTNGTAYSVSINGRIDGGAGGPGSTAVSATPRMAGTTWTAGTPPTNSDLRGVAYGTTFVAAGAAGSLFSSSDGTTWTALTNPLPATDLNAVNYDSYRAKYVSVGAGGAVISMTPASSSTWAQETSNTSNDLYSVANNAAGLTVAAGAGGTIISSSDGGATWTVQTSGTTNALNAVAYGYDHTNSQAIFVAVGAAGSVLHSVDGITWTAAGSGTANDLKGVTYGAEAGVFVAVGANGTVLTSTDGTTWAAQTSGTTATLNAVTYLANRRFVAVAADGSIYYNEYADAGVTWIQAATATGTALNAVTSGGLYDYSAVGASGANLYAD